MSVSPAALSPEVFVEKWAKSGGSERANYQFFLLELCDLLGVPRPDVSTAAGGGQYVFEREVREEYAGGTHTTRFIDFYRQGSFVLETKQGVQAQEAEENAKKAEKGKRTKKKGHGVRGTVSYDTAMLKAKEQAEAYARFLPAAEGRPPFVLVVDVGHVIEVYSEFTRTGGTYLPFPNAKRHRIPLADLTNPDVRAHLRTIWENPMSLDPSRLAALATREVTARLADLGKSLEASRDEKGKPLHTPEQVSTFLMRMIFTMFAEDMELIDKGKFLDALKSLRADPSAFVTDIGELWERMATGGRSTFLRANVKHFNGGLFEKITVLPVTSEQLELLISAAECNWSQVEPSIFGTLVERALNPAERHRLGAHYTPRAYVERLVNRVVMEPLRDDWKGVLVEVESDLRAVTETDDAQAHRKARENAVKKVEAFLAALRELSVLDPACGTGNFLYVSMELIKQLEMEAQEFLIGLGGQPQLTEVNPEKFLGLEINERAASVASLVLWIGYLQLYAKHHEKRTPPEPILRAFKNIRHTDAVLAYKNKQTHPTATRWDGQTRITDPATGRDIPDPNARINDVVYLSPTQPMWPMADFIVGNPPFIGAGPMRETLGDGYVKALRGTYKISKKEPGVPDSADFVMYWWFKAAQLLTLPKLRRFGFVTTNSIKQTFNRRVIEQALSNHKISVLYAVPDHPWVDAADGAAVRIAMTVVGRGHHEGVIDRVVTEELAENGEFVVKTQSEMGRINPDLTVGTNLTEAVELKAMQDLSSEGVKLHGEGFIVTPEQAKELGLGRIPGLENHIREFRNGRDMTGKSRNLMVIDLFGLSEVEVQRHFPEVYQHIKLIVKPERDAKAETKDGAGYAKFWWLFGKPRPEMRKALNGLARYIVTVKTAKHLTFQFIDASIIPESKLVAFASDDAYVLGVLSSRIHAAWSLGQGSTLEDRPTYVKTRCFETFPFPAATNDQKNAIRTAAAALDDHRKARLALHPDLTLTGLYNVLEKLRAGTALDDSERAVHDRGLVSTLRDLHDRLNALVAGAYGWPADLPTPEVLARLAVLNAERAAEERQEVIRYLRPEYQNPSGVSQDVLMEADPAVVAASQVPVFPKRLAEQSQAVRRALRDSAVPLSAGQVAKLFKGVRAERVEEVLDMLVALGQARETPEHDRYTA